jgi:hypothetical protein
MRVHLAEIPLGPFEGHPVRGFTTRTGKRTFHLQNSCGRLRRSSPIAVTEMLSGPLLERTCDGCFTYPDLAPRGSALYEFARAAFSRHFEYNLSRFVTEEVDAELTESANVDQEAAAGMITASLVDGEAEHKDEDDPTYEAGEFRDRLIKLWKENFDSLADSHEVLGRYQWLQSWAAERIAAKERGLGVTAKKLRELLSPFALFANAVASPDLHEDDLRGLSADARFAGLGKPDQQKRFLESVRRTWAYSLEYRLPINESSRFSAWWQFEDHFGKNRKGRAKAEQAVEECVNRWDERLPELVNAADPSSVAWLTIRIPVATEEHGQTKEHVTVWELAVAANYGVAYHWPSRTVLIQVPALIGDRLLRAHRDLEPSAVPASDSEDPSNILETWMASRHRPTPIGPLPGLLDDGPLAERRALTSGDVEALKLICEPEELFLTMSTSGIEPLNLETLAGRCMQGWTGVIVMRMSAPPKSVTAPHLEADPAKKEPESGGTYSRYSLEADEAAEEFAAALREDRFTNHDPAKSLAAYAIGRTLPDLRVLGTEDQHGPASWRVWHALLANEPLDLDPFRKLQRDGRIVLALPVGILNTVQVYTARYGGRKHHGVSCQHIGGRRVGLARDAELLTFPELLAADQYEWCHRCGGYSVRRMTTDQYDYYEAARAIYECAEDIYRINSSLRAGRSVTGSLDPIIADLKELTSSQITSESLSTGEWTWEWDRILRDLIRQADVMNEQCSGK